MTIYNVSPLYYEDNKIRYTVLPYSLKGTISVYLRYGKIKGLIHFLMNSRLTEKSARIYAAKKNFKKDSR